MVIRVLRLRAAKMLPVTLYNHQNNSYSPQARNPRHRMTLMSPSLQGAVLTCQLQWFGEGSQAMSEFNLWG